MYAQYALTNILGLLQAAILKMVQSHLEKRCDIFIYGIIIGIFLRHGLVVVWSGYDYGQIISIGKFVLFLQLDFISVPFAAPVS